MHIILIFRPFHGAKVSYWFLFSKRFEHSRIKIYVIFNSKFAFVYIIITVEGHLSWENVPFGDILPTNTDQIESNEFTCKSEICMWIIIVRLTLQTNKFRFVFSRAQFFICICFDHGMKWFGFFFKRNEKCLFANTNDKLNAFDSVSAWSKCWQTNQCMTVCLNVVFSLEGKQTDYACMTSDECHCWRCQCVFNLYKYE